LHPIADLTRPTEECSEYRQRRILFCTLYSGILCHLA